jgi:hypothetical protein
MTKPNLPRYYVYGDYSGNYGTHALAFEDGRGNTFYFSYQTLVAFNGPYGLKVRKNDWGPTTGKHLNTIDFGNRAKRLSAEAFEAAYFKAFKANLPARVA